MKKTVCALLAGLACFAALTGCGGEKETDVQVYSFSGENEQLKLSNGVIVLKEEKEVLRGGTLEQTPQELGDVRAYTVEFFLEQGGEKTVLLSNGAGNASGGTVALNEEIGSIAGDVFPNPLPEDWQNSLCFTLTATDRNGRQHTYLLELRTGRDRGDRLRRPKNLSMRKPFLSASKKVRRKA